MHGTRRSPRVACARRKRADGGGETGKAEQEGRAARQDKRSGKRKRGRSRRIRRVEGSPIVRVMIGRGPVKAFGEGRGGKRDGHPTRERIMRRSGWNKREATTSRRIRRRKGNGG